MSIKQSGSPRRRRAILAGLVVVAGPGTIGAAFAAQGPDPVVERGTKVALGEGHAESYVVRDESGRVTEIGVTLTEGALRGLPEGTGHSHGRAVVQPDGNVTHEHVLELPEGHGTPFQHLVVNWNPGGHEPPGIYDLPHFDVHFYTPTLAERLAMTPDTDPRFEEKSERLPVDELVPAGYVMPQLLPFPQMGLHWVDPTSPELNGAVFTHTFIVGSWDGGFHFWEPMVTKAFLESRQNVAAPVALPRRAVRAGDYPTGYAIRWIESERAWRIALTDLMAVPGA
ncbi:MAG: DUF5602 domain-containing protein [Longimicrobiales bacterium]